jgi:hypothetical protein
MGTCKMGLMLIQPGYRTTVRILVLYVTRDCKGKERNERRGRGGKNGQESRKLEDGERV